MDSQRSGLGNYISRSILYRYFMYFSKNSKAYCINKVLYYFFMLKDVDNAC